MKGNHIRSRVEWLNDQEKPSRTFCAIEHKKYLEKIAKKIKLKDGSICCDQKRILTEFGNFYATLFKKEDLNAIQMISKHCLIALTLESFPKSSPILWKGF